MTAVGGSIQSISVNGRLFAVAADADVNRSLGGFSNDVMPNGNNTARLIKTAVTWALEGITVSIDDPTGSDQEFLQDIANGLELFDVTIEYASGAVYAGKGQLTDVIQYTNQSATASLNFKGEGVLKQQ